MYDCIKFSLIVDFFQSHQISVAFPSGRSHILEIVSEKYNCVGRLSMPTHLINGNVKHHAVINEIFYMLEKIRLTY